MTTVAPPDVGILEVDEQTYHRDPDTISVSGLKTLLKSPARFLYERANPRPATDAMDTGSVCHELLLHGKDGRIRVLDAYDWKSPKIRAQRDEIRAQKLIAIHRGQLREAARMRQAVLRDPLVAGILATGRPEQSLYWTDPDTDVACRARLDWLRPNALVDVKTTFYGGTDDDALAKTAASMNWPMQAAHYSDGYEHITGERLPFLFLVIEREPPYLTRVVQLSDDDMWAGREKVRTALERYADYTTNGWPDPAAEITTLHMPRWYAAT